MATQRPALDAARSDFAARLLAEREVAPRAQAIAKEAADLTGASAAVYLYNATAAPRWSAKASVGDITAPASCEALTLHMLSERLEGLLFAGHELVREHYAHLDVRRTVAAMAYAPLVFDGNLLGAIEVISFDRVLNAGDLDALGTITHLSAVGLASALSYEDERNSSLQSITRLTQFYDLEKVFHSTLQMSELMPIITSKIRELFEVQAVNLWMVTDEDVLLMASAGNDPTLEIGAPSDDIIKHVTDDGKWVSARAPDDRLTKRNGGQEQGPIRNLLAYPVTFSDSIVGALECINKAGGANFNEDDLFFLDNVAESAGRALHNASLLEAERKVEILETLVEVSQEITSTLNLERVLQVIVNAPHRILEYDRAAVALQDRGKVQVKAVSGKAEVVQTEPTIKPLREMLEWAIGTESVHYVTVEGDQVQAEREETRAKFEQYFKTMGYRSWYSVPLADDQGQLGVLCFESRNPDFLSEAQIELIKVLGSQATVALRNASLYTEVPFIGVLEPILQKKQQFMQMQKSRRRAYLGLAAAVAVLLVVVPLPMRVSGRATVAPHTSAQIQAAEDGVIRNVYVREGDRVARGTVLAEMDDWEFRGALAEAQAKHQAALAAMNRALASNDGAEAGIQRAQADFWGAEVVRAGRRVEYMKLRSPIDGLVATPHVETLVGRKLSSGDAFAQVVNSSHATVDVALEETDVPLVEAGQRAAVKLDGFPTRRFAGQVEIVSPASAAENERRVFFARVDVANPDGLLRPGMQGFSKVSTGWKPAGYVLFRDLGMWAWTKLWKWFGW